MNVLITGIDGFIGKNLRFHLDQYVGVNILKFRHGDNFEILENEHFWKFKKIGTGGELLFIMRPLAGSWKSYVLLEKLFLKILKISSKNGVETLHLILNDAWIHQCETLADI